MNSICLFLLWRKRKVFATLKSSIFKVPVIQKKLKLCRPSRQICCFVLNWTHKNKHDHWSAAMCPSSKIAKSPKTLHPNIPSYLQLNKYFHTILLSVWEGSKSYLLTSIPTQNPNHKNLNCHPVFTTATV